MKALTVRQPWAWAIIRAGKDIENRDWPTRYRGPIAIHAAKGITTDEYWAFHRFINLTKVILREMIPTFDVLIRGAIIGIADLVDCVRIHDSEWFQGDYGFVLANPRPLITPVECRGALGLWNLPVEIEQRIVVEVR